MSRFIPLCILFCAAPALAVGTSHWTQSNEAQFKKGTFHNVVATNLGDLKLSRAVKSLLAEDARVSAVYCLAEAPDGTIYAGTGPHGLLLKIAGDKVTTALTLDDNSSISAILLDNRGRLLIGTCGEKGRVYRYDPQGNAAAQEIFSADGVQYVWSMAQTPDGMLYAATGPTGQLFEIKPDGSHSVVMSSDDNNLLSLLSDSKDLLYVGTDPSGLVYRVNRKTKDVFVLFDAEAQVSCLALDAKGNLYAGTANGGEKGEQPEEEQPEKIGRPEGTGGVPLPSKPPDNPKPPPPPSPNPGEPPSIPNNSRNHARGPVRSPVMLAVWKRPVDGVNDDDADDSAAPLPGPGTHPGAPAPTTLPVAPAQPEPPQQAPKTGNAIYRIDPEGFVTEIFRENVLVYTLIEHNGVLLVGTGGEGMIFQVNVEAQETSVLAKVDPKEITSMLALRDGRALLGLSNAGGIEVMSSGFADEGTYNSPVLDATQISRFGKMHLHGWLPEGTTLTVSTRSGNIQDADKAGWSKWTDETPAIEYMKVTTPSARFLQYRLTLHSANSKDSPVVDLVDVAYQMPNMAPVVHAVRVGMGRGNEQAQDNGQPPASGQAEGSKPQGTGVQAIVWEADDPNDDALTYSVYFRTSPASPWILLKDKLAEPRYDWDTRSVADGRYEVKVVASNAGANPPGQGKTGSRVSDAFIIDNTPPVIGDVKWSVAGQTLKIEARLVDRTTTVASCEYSVDSASDWQMVLPVDNIFDSPEARISLSIDHLSVGSHQVTLRAADAKGNMAYETIVVKVEK